MNQSPQKSSTGFNSKAKDMNATSFAAKMSKKTPRNLQEVPSAHDISAVNAPKNIYN